MRPSLVVLHIAWILNLSLALGLWHGHGRSFLNADGEAPTIPVISVREASQHLVSADVVFVDARVAQAYRSGFIPMGVSLPAGAAPTPEQLQQFRNTKFVIVYCDGADCEAGDQVAGALISMRFTNVWLMKEGMRGWVAAGLPVSKFPDSNEESR